MANDMSITDLSTILNAIVGQATGKTGIVSTNTADFVAVANTALQTGVDPVMKAISQVLTKTVFSVRPYSAKFKGLMVDEQRWGNHVRKLQVIDQEWENDNRIPLNDGTQADQYRIKKPKVLQTNFYGEQMYNDYVTIFKDQLDTAFSGPNQFGDFISMVMSNMSDRIEQAHESLARACIANFIGGKIKGDATNVLHLVTLYNDITGLNLTSDTVKQPENFVPFAKWAVGYVRTVSDRMTERSRKYHVNVTGKEISRHTPKEMQRLYLYSDEINHMNTSVLSSVFNDSYLTLGEFERVNFWQSIDSPDGIQVTPSYMHTDGSVKTEEMAMTQANILGVLMDKEACGMTIASTWSAPTPFNARGGYSNLYWHFTDRYWNDNTENAVVLLLD